MSRFMSSALFLPCSLASGAARRCAMPTAHASSPARLRRHQDDPCATNAAKMPDAPGQHRTTGTEHPPAGRATAHWPGSRRGAGATFLSGVTRILGARPDPASFMRAITHAERGRGHSVGRIFRFPTSEFLFRLHKCNVRYLRQMKVWTTNDRHDIDASAALGRLC